MSAGGPAIELTYELTLAAPLERVFAALTEARHLEHWFCDRAESEPRADGRIVLRWEREGASEPFAGAWTVFEPPTACAYRGGHAGYPDGDAGTVHFALARVETGTKLRIAHAMPDRPEYQPFAVRYRAAWPRALARLETYLRPIA